MIYPVRQHIEQGTTPDTGIDTLWAMDGEARAVQVLSDNEPRVVVPSGVTFSIHTLEPKTISSGAWYDMVDGNPSDCWLVDIKPPGPGEYELTINGDPLTIFVSDVAKPAQPTLRSAFGTTPPHPSINEESAAWFEGHGANENHEYFEVMVRIHRRMFPFGMNPYQVHWPVWFNNAPLTQDSSGYCVVCNFQQNLFLIFVHNISFNDAVILMRQSRRPIIERKPARAS